MRLFVIRAAARGARLTALQNMFKSVEEETRGRDGRGKKVMVSKISLLIDFPGAFALQILR